LGGKNFAVISAVEGLKLRSGSEERLERTEFLSPAQRRLSWHDRPQKPSRHFGHPLAFERLNRTSFLPAMIASYFGNREPLIVKLENLLI
jgi:hypothetical protein